MEVVVAAGVSTMVLFALTLALLSGMKSWAKGAAIITTDMSSQMGTRIVSAELRAAMTATIDSNGRGITYKWPVMDGDTFRVPMVEEEITRRIYYKASDKTLRLKIGEAERIIASNVKVTTGEGSGGTQANGTRIFTSNDGGVVRTLEFTLQSEDSHSAQDTANNRVRETINLRNVPSVTEE